MRALGVIVIVSGNGHGEPSSNLNRAVCISHSANTLELYDSNYFTSSYEQTVSQASFLNLLWPLL